MPFSCLKLAPSLRFSPALCLRPPLRGTMRASMVAFARAATAAASKPSPKPSSKPSSAPKIPMKVSKPRANNPLLKPQPLSPTLQSFLGVSELSRAETLKKLWVYIKANNLQSESSKRIIVCDEKLKALFGQDSLTMLEIPKLLNPHFVKQ